MSDKQNLKESELDKLRENIVVDSIESSIISNVPCLSHKQAYINPQDSLVDILPSTYQNVKNQSLDQSVDHIDLKCAIRKDGGFEEHHTANVDAVRPQKQSEETVGEKTVSNINLVNKQDSQNIFKRFSGILLSLDKSEHQDNRYAGLRKTNTQEYVQETSIINTGETDNHFTGLINSVSHNQNSEFKSFKKQESDPFSGRKSYTRLKKEEMNNMGDVQHELNAEYDFSSRHLYSKPLINKNAIPFVHQYKSGKLIHQLKSEKLSDSLDVVRECDYNRNHQAHHLKQELVNNKGSITKIKELQTIYVKDEAKEKGAHNIVSKIKLKDQTLAIERDKIQFLKNESSVVKRDKKIGHTHVLSPQLLLDLDSNKPYKIMALNLKQISVNLELFDSHSFVNGLLKFTFFNYIKGNPVFRGHLKNFNQSNPSQIDIRTIVKECAEGLPVSGLINAFLMRDIKTTRNIIKLHKNKKDDLNTRCHTKPIDIDLLGKNDICINKYLSLEETQEINRKSKQDKLTISNKLNERGEQLNKSSDHPSNMRGYERRKSDGRRINPNSQY